MGLGEEVLAVVGEDVDCFFGEAKADVFEGRRGGGELGGGFFGEDGVDGVLVNELDAVARVVADAGDDVDAADAALARG